MKPININEDCKFLKDIGTNSTLAMYNLITSKAAMELWCKGIKPNSNWKVSDVKSYFGMTGNKTTLLKNLNVLYDVVTNKV
tara:strand:- start:6430 stop:6672 length:243 start_codon:yes stop_codon:yes gene_type:complete